MNMEFVGNRINARTILATLTVAFFAGRISLFGGTFPAATALITVMLAVSTVYIYLIPVMAAAMLTFYGQGAEIFGDMLAMLFCGLFFLFFHRQRFSINQRTAVASAALIFFNALYYAAGHILYLFSVEKMVLEIVAAVIYIRVFNTCARAVFVRRPAGQFSSEKTETACLLLTVSLIGAVDYAEVVFPLWAFTAVIIQYCRGLQQAVVFSAAASVFWLCQGRAEAELFLCFIGALIGGWFLALLTDGRYRKTVLALTVFAVAMAAFRQQVYGTAAAMAVFIAVPPDILRKLWCVARERVMPETTDDTDLRIRALKQDLRKKREAFLSLGKLYSAGLDSRQIISYQFIGMARTVESLIEDLSGRGESARREKAAPVLVGHASYAFGSVSGDSCLSFAFGRNKQALVISDGMGKGSRAATESRLVVTTLSRLMEAGFDVDLAIKTVNAILMTDNSDMFATLDLAIIDRQTGRAQIFKMGAASTFVRHGNQVTMLKRPAPPAGVTDGLKLEYIDVKLRKGDLLLMVSDGVTDCDRKDPECFWLRQRLAEIGSRDPETVAELIINKAAEKYGIRERDDLTVMAAAL